MLDIMVDKMTPEPMINLKTGDKILIHLLEHQPGHIDQFNAPMSIAQEGIAKAIGINRTHIPRSLKKLVKKGMITEKRRHVPGARRKRKVYYLTTQGLERGEITREKLLKRTILVKTENKYIERNLQDISRELPDDYTTLDLWNSLTLVGIVDTSSLTKARDLSRKYLIYPDNIPWNKHFYGRKKELITIKQQWKDGRIRLFVITGIAGIGKTSLVIEAMKKLKDSTYIFYHRFKEFDTLRKMGKKFSSFLSAIGYPGLDDYLDSTVALDISTALEIVLNDFRNLETLVVLDDFHKCSTRISSFVKEAFRKKDYLGNVRFMIISREKPLLYDQKSVVVDKSVFEMRLEGLSPSSSEKMLKENLEAELPDLKTIHAMTEGHPLLLELLSLGDEKDPLKGGKMNITRYLEDEVLSGLKDESNQLLRRVSVFRRPFKSTAIRTDDGPIEGTLQSLTYKNILLEDEGCFEMHDLIRDHILERTPEEEKSFNHLIAANYYKDLNDSEAWLEATYHFIQAEEYERAFEMVKEKGGSIMEKEHFEEFREVLEIIDEKIESREVKAQVLHFKGTIYIYWLLFSQAVECLEEAIGLWDNLGEKEKMAEAKKLLKRAQNHYLY